MLKPGELYGPIYLVRVQLHVGEKQESSLLQGCQVDGVTRPFECG
jgi:hypothetical protein